MLTAVNSAVLHLGAAASGGIGAAVPAAFGTRGAVRSQPRSSRSA
jgi:hypothetical protein